MKKALITGVTGQDGSYLSEFLLEKGYEVHGIIRRSSVDFRERIVHLEGREHFHLHYGDLTDSISLVKSAATDDMIGVVSDTVSLVGSAVKSLQGSVSSKGTIASISAHQQPYRLLSRFFEIATRDTANAGRPLCDMRTINTLSGFQQIANSHVAISGTSTEAGMINSYLEAGFYYE